MFLDKNNPNMFWAMKKVYSWVGGWVDGWMDGCKSPFKDCLQQSKTHFKSKASQNLITFDLLKNRYLQALLCFSWLSYRLIDCLLYTKETYHHYFVEPLIVNYPFLIECLPKFLNLYNNHFNECSHTFEFNMKTIFKWWPVLVLRLK